MSNNCSYMNLNNEFDIILKNFVNKELNKKRNQKIISSINIQEQKEDILLKQKDNDYCSEIMKYMKNNNYFKEKIIEKAKSFISKNEKFEGNNQNLIDIILRNNYINKNSIDIISCILRYIKEEIFGKYIKNILAALEDNNILTTLVQIQNNINEIEAAKIKEFLEKALDGLTYDEKKEYDPKFSYDYKNPGLINAFEENKN